MRLPSALFLLGAHVALASTVAKRQVQCLTGVQIFGIPYFGGNNLGIMESTAAGVMSAINNSATTVIQYDSGNTNHSIGIASGVAAVKAAIEQYDAACPNYPMGLMGWSQGGIVLMNLLCDSHDEGLDPSYHPNIIGSVAYGDETYVPNQPWSRGKCPQAGGESVPRTDPDACLPWKGAILDYCDVGDPYCCAGPSTVGHAAYAQEYDNHVVKFFLKRYQRYGKLYKKKSGN